MKEIIEEVLQAEENVGLILKQAREKADEIRRSAEKEASENMNAARQQAQDLLQKNMVQAEAQAGQIRQEKLKQAEHEKENLVHDNADTIAGLVDEICNLIVTTEYEKDNA
ncbi:MAG: hypothetical protein JW860_15100 [Sedimentisphaerales bacterium]|nr:hypothetical protein [Sedimentisphaerales bacterium]